MSAPCRSSPPAPRPKSSSVSNDRLLVLLHVLGIGQRQALERDQRAVRSPTIRPVLARIELGRVGIALLRHDRAAGGEAVRQARRSRTGRTTRSRSPPASRDRCTARMRRRWPDEVRADEVAVGHGIDRVGRGAGKAQRPHGRHAPVDRVGGPASAAAPAATRCEPRATIVPRKVNPLRVRRLPKVRPKGVTDGHPVNIPDLPCVGSHDGETQKDKQAVLWL